MKLIAHLYFIIALPPFWVQAQSAYQDVREGNQFYQENQYEKAITEYRESISSEDAPIEGFYNLGILFIDRGNSRKQANIIKWQPIGLKVKN